MTKLLSEVGGGERHFPIFQLFLQWLEKEVLTFDCNLLLCIQKVTQLFPTLLRAFLIHQGLCNN